MSDSVAFDRAAEYYDRTRALPQEAMDELVAHYGDAFAGCRRILEPGIGTGRIALPLRAAGLPVAGIDLAPAMLAQLRANAADGPCPPVAVADATRLPFSADVFDGAYVVHMLHLVPNWRDVVHEIVRVVVPRGRFVIDQGSVPHDRDIHRAFQEAVGLERRFVGLEQPEPLMAFLDEVGAPPLAVHAVSVRHTWRPAVILHNIAENRYSWTWRLDDDTRRQGMEAATAWAHETFGDLDAPVESTSTINLRVYELP